MPEQPNSFTHPALTIDLNDTYVGRDIYTYARNATFSSDSGGVITNEESNSFCFEIPHTFIGSVDLNNDTHLIFSTADNISEIGIGDLINCTYTTLVSDPCLGFDTSMLITGVAKKLFNGDTIATFGAKGYPTRRLNINDIPFKYTLKSDECKTKVYTKEINCEETLLFKKITQPCLSISKGHEGNLPNGTYSVALAYVIKGQVFSDYFTTATRIQLFSLTQNSAINLSVSDLDRDFDSYQLILMANVDGVKTNYIMGEYPTFQSSVEISDLGKATLPTSALVIRKKTWQSAGIISSNSNYLLLADLSARPELNYQLQAMGIKARCVVKQVPLEYYEQSPEEIGYWGDENYDFCIEWQYDTAEFSKHSHIPGIKLRDEFTTTPSGEDVYEWDQDDKPTQLQKWQVENTAGELEPTNDPFINRQRIAYRCDMGFFQSTELYPDNAALFGAEACTPIRYHKFPEIPRYEVIEGKTYVNIKGVEFSNITYPLNASGKPVEGIKGYRILRSDRKGGNKTVISAGVLTNVRKYTDEQNKREIMFSNYPFNDLSADVFLSQQQTVFKGNKEQNFVPLTDYYKNRFNFYSPHSYYNLKYKHGTEFKIISEEVAEVTGNFEPVYGHPKLKLLSNFSFWTAAIIGSIEAVLEMSGATSKTIETGSETEIGVTGGVTNKSSVYVSPKTALAVAGTSVGQLTSMIVDAVKSGNVTSVKDIINLIKNVLLLLTTAGITAVLFTVSAMRYAQNILDTIYNFLSFNQYAYQLNAKAVFNQSTPTPKGTRRRRAVSQPEYLSPALHTIEGTIFNNFGKQESVYVELNRDLNDPRTKDDSRKTISLAQNADNPQKEFQAKASLYYAKSKINNPNQYGQLGSNPQVLISPCIHTVDYKPNTEFTSPVLFGGDCIIARQSVITKQPFFRQNLAIEYGNDLPANFPDGTEYNYNLYRNVAYPRFWVDSTKYDYSSLLSKKVVNFSSFSRTTSSKHNLDCKGADKQNVFSVDDAYFYLYANGVMEFIAEADFNISFREETTTPHYSHKHSSLSEIFKSTYLAKPEEFKLSKAYSDLYTTEVYSEQLPLTFNPLKDTKTDFPNAVIYSLPAFNLQTGDNWQYFLPNNFFSFRESDFGFLQTIRKLDQDRLIFLFSKSSPFLSMGQDFLSLDNSGRKVSVGDGGLFAQDPREIMPTDDNFGSCTSPHAFTSSRFGSFYPSERHSSLISFSQSLDDISSQGVASWCRQYMPIQLYSYFPSYPKVENPINGVGYLISYRPTTNEEVIYITKRDFRPLRDVGYDASRGQFMYNSTAVSLRDPLYFEDISWTLSYSLRGKGFISFHDWQPDWTIQMDTHFITVKNNKAYKHDFQRTSFCNFYGKNYPFSLEFVNSDGAQVTVLKSIEYVLEAYHYKNGGRDKVHLYRENFDKLLVYNTEQCSPQLTLVKHPENPKERFLYPKLQNDTYLVLYSKEENRHRVNMFWDSIKDRGEFTQTEEPIFISDDSGYKKKLNPQAIDLAKPEKERKKFREYLTHFLFTKEISGATRFMLKIFNAKKIISPR